MGGQDFTVAIWGAEDFQEGEGGLSQEELGAAIDEVPSDGSGFSVRN